MVEKLLKYFEQTDKNIIASLRGRSSNKQSFSTNKKYIFTISEAARFLGVSVDTLRGWDSSGKITPQRTKGGARRFTLRELNKLISQTGNKYKVLNNISNYHPLQQKTIPFKLITTVGISVASIASLVFLALVVRSSFQKANTSQVGSDSWEVSKDSSVLGISDEEIDSSLDINIPTNIFSDLTVKGKVIADELTALNIIYSLSAGDGVSISSGQKPTIKNTGVLSLQSKTGVLTLTEGTDITIDGLKITNKSTLDSVRGRGGCSSCITDADVVAGLTISSGSVNNSPIGASTASTGAFTTLSASSTLGVTGATTLSSTLAVTGATTLNGNITLGDTTLDTITFTGRVASSIVPTTTGTSSLGTSALAWSQLYLTGIASIGGQSTFTSPPSSNQVSGGVIYINPLSVDVNNYTLFGIAVGGVEKLRMDADGNVVVQGTIISGSSGVAGHWNRIGSTLAPYITTDTISIPGNIGVGFSVPDRKLQVGADANLTGSNASLLGASGTQLALTGSSVTNINKKLTVGLDTTDNYGVIQVGNTDGTSYNLSLNPAGGNVGVGTTSPSAILEVIGSANINSQGTSNTTIGNTTGDTTIKSLIATGYNLVNNFLGGASSFLANFDGSHYSTRGQSTASPIATVLSYITGKVNQALNLMGVASATGNSDVITFQRGSQVAGYRYETIDGNQGSISFWFKPNWASTAVGDKVLFEFPSLMRLIYNATTDQWDFGYYNGSNYTAIKVSSANQSFSAGTWIYLAATWDVDNSPYLQLKVSDAAIAQYTTSVITAQTPGATFYIGANSSSQNGASGAFDDFIITDQVLRQIESGTVTTSSTTVTGTSTSFFKLAQSGYQDKFKLADDSTVYTVNAISSNTSLALSTAPSTHASATNFQAGQITALYNNGSGSAASLVEEIHRLFYATMDGSGNLSVSNTTTNSTFGNRIDWGSYNSSTNANGQITPNGTMEAASSGTPTSWSASSTPTLADAETANILSDTRSQKITVTAISRGITLSSNITVSSGDRYRVAAYLKSDGTNRANLRIRNVTDSADMATLGTTSSEWTLVQTDITIPSTMSSLNLFVESGSSASYSFYVDNVGMWKMP